MRISENEMIERGKRLKMAMERFNVRNKDFVADGINNGIVSHPSIVSAWIKGGQIKNGKRCGYLTNTTIDDIVRDILPEVRPEYLKCYDDFMTKEEENAYNERIKQENDNNGRVTFNTHTKQRRTLICFVLQYLWLLGYDKMTVYDGKGEIYQSIGLLNEEDYSKIVVIPIPEDYKNLTPRVLTKEPLKYKQYLSPYITLAELKEKWKVVFSSDSANDDGICENLTMSVGEWDSLIEENQDLIAFQIERRLFKDRFSSILYAPKKKRYNVEI